MENMNSVDEGEVPNEKKTERAAKEKELAKKSCLAIFRMALCEIHLHLREAIWKSVIVN